MYTIFQQVLIVSEVLVILKSSLMMYSILLTLPIVSIVTYIYKYL